VARLSDERCAEGENSSYLANIYTKRSSVKGKHKRDITKDPVWSLLDWNSENLLSSCDAGSNLQCESKNPSLRFSEIFSQTVGNF